VKLEQKKAVHTANGLSDCWLWPEGKALSILVCFGIQLWLELGNNVRVTSGEIAVLLRLLVLRKSFFIYTA
jgi:hypothetical protein